MRFNMGLFASTLVCVLSGCGNSQVNSASTGKARPQARVAVRATNWKVFSPQGGKFSFLVPGTPTLKTSISHSVVGPLKTFSYELYVLQGKYKQYYSLTYVDYPASMIESVKPKIFLTKLVWPDINAHRNRLIYQKDIVNNGFPGKEWQFKAEQNLSYWVTNQTYLANNRLYQISAFMRKRQLAEGDTTKFFSSIHLSK